MRFFKYVCLTLVIITFWSCSSDPIAQDKIISTGKKDYKILFVGNSFTFYNSGVDFHLQQMLNADKSSDSINYLVQKIAVSSYTLQDHYTDSLTVRKIAGDKWNTVVLQEQSTRPINNPDLFLLYAQKLDANIKKVGAKTTLYMTWAPKATPTDINQIAASYISVGQNLKAPVVPIGKVWQYIINKYPTMNLYFTDDKHPNLLGTYINACCFYYSLFEKNPLENSYIPIGISTTDASRVKQAVKDYISQN
jgi:hypothetical protein